MEQVRSAQKPDLDVRQVKNDISQLTLGINEYIREFGKPPDSSENVEIMRVLGEGHPPILTGGFRNSANEMIDPWGTPYHIVLHGKAPPFVYSCGPNKRDEGGKGDDITSEQ